MLSALLGIMNFLLACGLAGILIAIGAIALLGFLLKQIVINIYYTIHTRKKSNGGDNR